MAVAGILLAAALGGGLLFIARCFSSVARKVALRMPAGGPMEGKTAIITGANSGLGRATAAELLRQGARVIMACRDCGRAEEAARELRAEVGLCSRGGGECRGELVVHELDLASLRSVRSFCQQVLKVRSGESRGGVEEIITPWVLSLLQEVHISAPGSAEIGFL